VQSGRWYRRPAVVGAIEHLLTFVAALGNFLDLKSIDLSTTPLNAGQ
jgi:hypothetical protein